jgi:hypothetical protein
MRQEIRAFGLACAALQAAGPAMAAEAVPMDAEHWETAGWAQFVDVDGRTAARLGTHQGFNIHAGTATLRHVAFETGTIEFDLFANEGRDFISVAFRVQDSGDGELFYIRTHQNGNPDATQYTPVVNGSPAWQIFTGEGFTSQVRFDLGQWMHFRVDVFTDSALVSIDGQPALVIPDLKSDLGPGGLELGANAGAYFANFTVTPIANHRDPASPPASATLPPGTVKQWQVSPALTEAEALTRARMGDWSGLDWTAVPAEFNGIGNLSRAGADGGDRHSYIARFTARSPSAQDLPMEFGFSDSAQVFLGRRLLYAGDDRQASRDYRFLGIVGFWDRLYLPLAAGLNEVVFVVTDGTNGGTAAAARFPPEAGLAFD